MDKLELSRLAATVAGLGEAADLVSRGFEIDQAHNPEAVAGIGDALVILSRVLSDRLSQRHDAGAAMAQTMLTGRVN